MMFDRKQYAVTSAGCVISHRSETSSTLRPGAVCSPQRNYQPRSGRYSISRTFSGLISIRTTSAALSSFRTLGICDSVVEPLGERNDYSPTGCASASSRTTFGETIRCSVRETLQVDRVDLLGVASTPS